MASFFKKVVALSSTAAPAEAEENQSAAIVSDAAVVQNDEADGGVEDVSLNDSEELEEEESEEDIEEEEEAQDVEYSENASSAPSDSESSIQSDEKNEDAYDVLGESDAVVTETANSSIKKVNGEPKVLADTPRPSKKSNPALNDIDEEQLLQSIIKKKLEIFPLKEWEEDRKAYYRTFVKHTDPIYNDIIATTDRGRSICRQASVLFAHISDALEKMAEQLERLTNFQLHVDKALETDAASSPPPPAGGVPPASPDSPLGEEAIPEVSTEATAVSSTPEKDPPSTAAKERVPKATPLRVAPGKWMALPEHPENSLFEETKDYTFLLEIMQFFYKGASEWHSTALWIAKDLVLEKLDVLKTDYESKVEVTLDLLKQIRFNLFKSARKCEEDWLEYDLIFKEIEKMEIQQSGIRKCSWLSERKYRLSARIVADLQRMYFKELINVIIKIQQFEKSREESLQEYLKLFLSTSLGMLSSSTSLTTALVDAHRSEKSVETAVSSTRATSEHRALKVPSLGLLSSTEASSEAKLSTGGNTLPPRAPQVTFKYLSDPNSSLPPVETAEKPSETEEMYRNFPGFKRLMEFRVELDWPDMESVPTFFKDVNFSLALHQLEISEAPKTTLVIKTGRVERLSGLKPFSKWSPCLLVLTWDRFLHFFKDFSDSVPLHSVNLAAMALKVSDIKGANETPTIFFELRDKGWNIMASNRGCAFKTVDPNEAEEWVARLKVATSAKDFVSASSEQFRHDVEGTEQMHPYFTSKENVYSEDLEGPTRSTHEASQGGVVAATKGEGATKSMPEKLGGNSGAFLKGKLQNLALTTTQGGLLGKKGSGDKVLSAAPHEETAQEREDVVPSGAAGEGEEATEAAEDLKPPLSHAHEEEITDIDEHEEPYGDYVDDAAVPSRIEGGLGMTEEPVLPVTATINPFGDEDD